MITLAIETSCDETAVCLLETEKINSSDAEHRGLLRYRILGNLVNSQIDLHRHYGGVFPIMAKREHAKNLPFLIEQLLRESGIAMSSSAPRPLDFLKEKESQLLESLLRSSLLTQKPAIDQIAVTHGPGLEPALWVGVNCARALSTLWDVPVIPVNHMEGHIFGSFLPDTSVNSQLQPLHNIALPALALLVSGGHTELVLVKNVGDYEVVGRTKDDAVGEAYDKVARMLDLPYPGGIEIQQRAEKFRTTHSERTLSLPRPMIHSHDLNFSFSGLKTAVLYTLRDEVATNKDEIACEFEDAVTEVLITKTRTAIEKYGVASLVIGGGVSANTHLRTAFTTLASTQNIPLYLPPPGVSGDNALMIALVGALTHTRTQPSHPHTANGNLVL